MSLRVGFQTFGCRSNYADTVDLQAAVIESGGLPCSFESSPDVYVVNTCTVTDEADKEALRSIRKIHRRNPNARIVITGCMAEAKGEELLNEAGVSAVVGPGQRAKVLAAVFSKNESENIADKENNFSKKRLFGRTSLPKRWSISLHENMSKEILGPGNSMGEIRTRARYHLRVQEGCENSCTFCIIPQTRGRLSSRPIELILSDIKRLSNVGYREIVLTGTHLGGYGLDVNSSLFALLNEISVLNISSRIRLSSIDPNDLSTEIVDLISKNHIFCRHLHICIQAFRDRTLKRMNRRYRMQDVEKILWYTQSVIPGVQIGSDVICGFPGESRQEVDKGIEEFLRLPISYLHVFPYSERSGTAAVRLDGSVEPIERKRRAARWRSEALRKSEAFLSSLVGKRLGVVIESITDDGQSIFGTSNEYVACMLPSSCFNSVPKIGELIEATAICYNKEQQRVVCQ